MVRQRKLEKILKEIFDIPIRFVGAESLDGFMKEIQRIEKNPIKVAEIINRKLQDGYATPGYLATPERVDGSVSKFKQINAQFKLLTQKNGPYERLPEYYIPVNFRDFGIFHPLYFGLVNSPVKSSVRVLYHYFRYANERRISQDGDFGGVTIDYLKGSYRKIRKRISDALTIECDSWMDKVLEGVLETDWKSVLSREEFIKRQTENYQFAQASRFSASKICTKMIKRNVLEKHERQVLSLWLREIGADNFDEACYYTENDLKSRRKRVKECRSGNYSDNIIQKAEELLESITFLRRYLLSQRDYVERFLSS